MNFLLRNLNMPHLTSLSARLGSLFGLAGLILTMAIAESPKAAPRPNIIILLADDLGYGDIGCYGAKKIKTPHLDQMAAEGMRFTDAHSPASICQPSRYAILAGRYYWRRQPVHNGIYFQENEATVPALLKSLGYATACIGKWHLGFGTDKKYDPSMWSRPLKPGPCEVGFDTFYGTPRSHNEPPFVFVENDRIIDADPKDPIQVIPGSKTTLGYGYGISIGGVAAHKARPEDQVDVIIAQKAVAYIQQQSAEKPFFIYLPFVAPHVPLAPSRTFQGTSEAGVYGDYVQELDWCVGEVIKALKEKGLAENTLIFFTSDNGGVHNLTALRKGHRSNANLLGQKTDVWEGGHRIPFIARWPGKIPARTINGKLISQTDIMATALAAVGQDLPAGVGPDSLNQLPILLGQQSSAIRTEMIYQSVGGYAIRSGNWKYLPTQGSMGFTAHPVTPWQNWRDLGHSNSEFDDNGKLRPDAAPEQLYNIEADPNEHQNVFAKHPDLAKELREKLLSQVPKVSAERN